MFLGGQYGAMVYMLPIPSHFKGYDIVHLEMVNIIVAAKIWANHWSIKRIQILCYNLAVIQVLNTGKARYSVLATCTGNLWLIAALFNIEFIITHILGKTNVVVDLLSCGLSLLIHWKNWHNWFEITYGFPLI